MFAVTASAALLMDYLGVLLVREKATPPDRGRSFYLRALAGLAVGTLGPAVSAGLVTRDFGTALLGSLLGSGVALVAILPFAQSGAPHGVLFSMYALIHGGIAMATVMR